jgi:hypothetical protein
VSGIAKLRRAVLCAALAALAAGCVSDDQVRRAISEVNREWQRDYEGILADRGIRTYKVARMDAFVALHAGLSRLGMRIVDQDPDLGTLNVEAAAPRPLDAAEWRRAADADLPRLRDIARKHIGLAAQFISFEPEGLDIVINATVIEVPGGTEVSLTTRMREVAPPRSGMPRREYPPPTGVRMALDKIWGQFEAELRAARKLP